jgi:hypothetical protein
MTYILVKDKMTKREVEIKTMEDLWNYSRGYNKIEVDFEEMTIYLSQKK